VCIVCLQLGDEVWLEIGNGIDSFLRRSSALEKKDPH